jgi:Domain of unknown function (DUF6265)
MKLRICLLSLALASFLSVTALAQTAAGAAKNAPSTASSAKVSSLHFLAGHWEGHVDDAKIEQTCSISDPSVMVCMFQLVNEKGTQMVEFYTIRDTAAGVEERVRFFSPELKEEPGDGLTMQLASSSASTFVFVNANGTYPKRSTLTRTSENEFHSHIELVDAQGKASNIDAYWKKTM